MLSMMKAAALAVVLAAGATAAWAEPESRWSDSAELVVTAPPTVDIHSICPGMWRLSKGEATVWVMPVLTHVPDVMPWNSDCFKRRVKNTQYVLVQSPPRSLWPHDRELPTGVALKDVVTPAAYDRFLQVVHKVHLPVARFTGLKPVWVGVSVSAQVQDRAKINWQFYPNDLPDILRDAHVPAREVLLYTGGEDYRNALRNQLTGADAEACMLGDLNRAEYFSEVVPVLAKAWRRADMATLMKTFPPTDAACVPKGMSDPVPENNIARWKEGLDTALATPGKVVAVVPIEWFLYKGAVLDQLKAEGVAVSAPKDTE